MRMVQLTDSDAVNLDKIDHIYRDHKRIRISRNGEEVWSASMEVPLVSRMQNFLQYIINAAQPPNFLQPVFFGNNSLVRLLEEQGGGECPECGQVIRHKYEICSNCMEMVSSE